MMPLEKVEIGANGLIRGPKEKRKNIFSGLASPNWISLIVLYLLASTQCCGFSK
jgi:hypothetical protein